MTYHRDGPAVPVEWPARWHMPFARRAVHRRRGLGRALHGGSYRVSQLAVAKLGHAACVFSFKVLSEVYVSIYLSSLDRLKLTPVQIDHQAVAW